jgi:hypothetical protein
LSTEAHLVAELEELALLYGLSEGPPPLIGPGAGTPPTGAAPPRLPLPPPVAPSKGPAAAGSSPQSSRTWCCRGGPIGASGRARRRDDATTPISWRRRGPRADPAEG